MKWFIRVFFLEDQLPAANVGGGGGGGDPDNYPEGDGDYPASESGGEPDIDEEGSDDQEETDLVVLDPEHVSIVYLGVVCFDVGSTVFQPVSNPANVK